METRKELLTEDINQIIKRVIWGDYSVPDKVIGSLLKTYIDSHKMLAYYEEERFFKIVSLIAIHDRSLKDELIKQVCNTYKKTKDILPKKFLGRVLHHSLFPQGTHIYSIDSNIKDKIVPVGMGKQFSYIPSGVDGFIEILEENNRFKEGKRFIDVGCGIGDKVLLSRYLTEMESYGIEYDTYTYGIAKEQARFNQYDHRIVYFNGNAIDFDYGRYDRIFTYQPIRDDEGLQKLYRRIINTMPDNAIWAEYSYGRVQYLLEKEFKEKRIINSKYYTVKSKGYCPSQGGTVNNTL